MDTVQRSKRAGPSMHVAARRMNLRNSRRPGCFNPLPY